MPNRLCVLFLLGVLASCGDTRAERGLSGAGIGAASGLLLGPPGLLAGAAAGATTGILTDREDIYLGRPVWD